MYKKISAVKKQAAAVEEITRIKAPSDGKCSKIGYTEGYNSIAQCCYYFAVRS